VQKRLAGKVAIVTGGAGSIGRQHSLLFAAQGAKVVVNDLGVSAVGDGEMAQAERVVDEIRRNGGEALASSDSAASFAGAEAIVGRAVDAFGTVDILVNNATTIEVNDIWRFTEEQFDQTVNANFKGYFAMIKYAAPYLCRQGGGAIVNTSSGSGFGHPSNSVYAAAKEGLIGLTRSAARELGRFGVRCNAIRPSAASYSATHAYQESTSPCDPGAPRLRMPTRRSIPTPDRLARSRRSSFGCARTRLAMSTVGPSTSTETSCPCTASRTMSGPSSTSVAGTSMASTPPPRS
jgi:NAD(P)-dependent dehydrogenase (short-subunit alcohol dehydrogenase family)